jgi:hypothetical protein
MEEMRKNDTFEFQKVLPYSLKIENDTGVIRKREIFHKELSWLWLSVLTLNLTICQCLSHCLCLISNVLLFLCDWFACLSFFGNFKIIITIVTKVVVTVFYTPLSSNSSLSNVSTWFPFPYCWCLTMNFWFLFDVREV